MTDERKSSMRVVTFDVTDPANAVKLLEKCAIIMAALFEICEGPEQAYVVVDQVRNTIARCYNISGVQDVYMQTEMKQ